MLNMKAHLASKQEFTNWLTTMYLFYLINRIIDFEAGVKLLPELHRRVSYGPSLPKAFQQSLTLPLEHPLQQWH